MDETAKKIVSQTREKLLSDFPKFLELEGKEKFFLGEKIDQDLYAAFQWYRKAAVKGNGAAQFNLGLCYDQGLGVQPNKFEAFVWYQRAAQAGIIQAKFNLAIYYKDGAEFLTDSGLTLLEVDLPRAIALLEHSANTGFAPSKRELAKLRIPNDIIITSQEKFDLSKEFSGSISYYAAKEGIIV